MSTLYQALGVAPDADEPQIKAAYRSLARRFHPDVNAGDAASADRLAEINQAYETLGNAEARAAYDRELAQRKAEVRRRYTIFAATSLATFVVTVSIVSFAVRWHLAAASGPATPAAASAAVGSPDGSPMPTVMPQPHGGHGLAGPNDPAANWTTFRDTRFDFALRYPAGVFAFDAGQSNANVRTFLSHDGRASLRIVAAQNTAGLTPASFRRALIKERYAGAAFESAPRRRHWFALSGTKGGEVFVERITFSCDGRSMHGWQLRYPSSERASYDAIAKLVLRNHPHGNGPGASCGAERGKPKPAKKEARRRRY